MEESKIKLSTFTKIKIMYMKLGIKKSLIIIFLFIVEIIGMLIFKEAFEVSFSSIIFSIIFTIIYNTIEDCGKEIKKIIDQKCEEELIK